MVTNPQPERPATSKNYTYGTHRLRDPAETLRLISPHFPAMGLTRIADLTGLDSIGIPVCNAIRPNSKSLSVSQGKGLNLMLAKVSAAMESIELYHAENVQLEVTTGSYQALAHKANVVDPARLNLHPQTCYQPDLSIAWVRGVDLIRETECFVPYDLVHCSLLTASVKAPIFFISSSGLASGNHRLEAISHGICEVIERDATHLWELKLGQGQIELVDLDTVDSRPCRELLARLDEAGFATYVWSMTADVELPVFGCAIVEGPASISLLPLGIYHGYGCHLSKEVAFCRAVTEAAQSRLTYISGARDDLFREEYEIAQSEFNRAQWEKLLGRRPAALDFRKLPSRETDSLAGDIAVQLSLLQRAGFDQVIVVDLTQPRFEIPVVRVIIPDMAQSPDEGMTHLSGRAKDYALRQFMVERLLSGDFSQILG